MVLKVEHEATFNQGYHFGFRIAMVKQSRGLAKIYRKHGDTEMYNFYNDQAKQWLGLARLVGRRFCSFEAQENTKVDLYGNIVRQALKA